MRKISISLFLLVLTISISAIAGQHYKNKMHKWWESEEIVTEVGLSEEQVKQIAAIDESYADKFKTLHGELRALGGQVHDLMGDPKSTDEAITAKHNEKMAKKAEMMNLKLEKKLKMRSVLNEEQIVKLSGIFKEKMGPGGEGKDCPYKDGKQCGEKHGKEGCSYKEKA